MTVFGIPHIRTYESTHLRIHSIHRRVGIYLHRNSIARYRSKVLYAGASRDEASNPIARNRFFITNVYR